MHYNDRVYPYAAIYIWYLDVAMGYGKDRDMVTVGVEDISFEPGKEKEGNFALVSYDE